jgi:cathepsin B
MKSFFLLIGLIALCSCNFLNNNFKITPESLKELKEKASYEIYQYEEHPFKDMTAADIRKKLGLLGVLTTTIWNLPEGKITEDIPENFLAKEKWPECIHSIRDQGKCGSCWAFSASEVLSDRFCISSGGKTNVILSPQDMVSCDKNDMGCYGGYLNNSWEYLIQEGIVTDECYPYTSGSGDSGTCQLEDKKCMNPKVDYKKYHASAFYNFKSINEIKSDIFTNGPVETGFLVYSDFLSYKSGIYRKNSEELLGGHAVKIVGWGLDDATKTSYWVVANSWGPNWGEDGFFKFEIGNCCNFEAQAIAGTPKL